MGAVGLLLHAQLRQHGRSWLALAVLIALGGGLVMAAAATARATSAAFPAFVSRYGYDDIVYTPRLLPQLARMPQVTRATPIQAPFVAAVGCAGCGPINASQSFDGFEVAPRDLDRTVKLVSGRMPDQSDPGQTLASTTVADDSGVRVGSQVTIYTPTQAQVNQAQAQNQAVTPSKAQLARVPHSTVRVTGLVVTENEFPAGNGPRYDLFPTQAWAAAVNPHTQVLTFYYVKLRHGPADQAAFDSQLRPLQTLGADDLDTDAAAVQRSITPQAAGWWGLAGLIALAGLTVLGQAAARQFSTDADDHAALSAMGLRARQFVLFGLARAFVIGLAGAAGAVALAAALSPLTPVGEARLAAAHPGAVSLDPLVTLIGAPGLVAALLLLSLWPAVRHARLRRPESLPPPAGLAVSVVRAVAAIGAPPSLLVGVRYALERGRGRAPVPVGTALLGTVLAVTALTATTVFGASLAWLINSPALYGVPYQTTFSNSGDDPQLEAYLTGKVVSRLTGDPAIDRVTLAAGVELNINGQHVRAIVVKPVQGAALISPVDGRLPRGGQDIALGAATLRELGAATGDSVRVTVTDPVTGQPRTTGFRVSGRASFAPGFGTGGFGNGAALTLPGLLRAQCPAGNPGTAACQRQAQQGLIYSVLVHAVPGPSGAAALAKYNRVYHGLMSVEDEPTELVNFGESVSFPLLFGAALSLFGAATLLHLLLVTVRRRRAETGLLKVLGFVRRQVAEVVGWQATTVVLAGVVVGVPLGIAAGKAAWRLFAVNFGVVPVSVVQPVPLILLAATVLLVTILLAVPPALLAARARPADLLRTE
ncbi:MAG TPA: FtsX-like permease family protein [Streptosporangiaceae bacterium]|nr:FtsX-like permease family protein [Streptosporangiaceae bacterium]